MKISFNDLTKVIWLYWNRNRTFLELYKNFLWYTMDREVLLEMEWKQWMANIKNPITFVIVSTIYWMYLDNSVAFEVYKQVRRFKWEWLEEDVLNAIPDDLKKKVEEENKEKDEYAQLILDMLEYIYSQQWADDVLDEIALHAIITWTWYWGIEYLKYEETYEYVLPWKGKKDFTDVVDTPTIYTINPLNFFPSRATDRWKKTSKYDIVRKVMTKETFEKQFSVYELTLKEKEVREKWSILILKDWDMVLKNLLFNNLPWVTRRDVYYSGWIYWTWNWPYHSDILTDNSFQIWWDLYEIYEVHTDYTVQIFVNWIDHWVYPRLWPRKKRPFFRMRFKSGLNWEHWIWAAYIAYPYQKVTDQFLNLRIDTDRIAASQPLAVSSDESFFDWMDHLELYPWKLIKMHDPQNWLVSLQTVQPWTVANQEVDLLSNAVKESLWLSWYAIGSQNKIERSARWVQELINASQRMLKEFVKEISKAMSFVSKYLIILCVEYMNNDTMKKILWTDKLKELSVEDLIKDYVVSFDMQPLKSSTDSLEADLLRKFIQETAWLTRPNGTPLLDQEAAYKMLLDKLNLPEDLLLTDKEAVDYQKQQIEDKYELMKYEQEKQQEQWVSPQAQSIMPQWQSQQIEASGLPWWIPWVQWWQITTAKANVTNPTWNNEPMETV